MSDAQPTLQEVLPKAGLVFSEKGSLAPVLCKPKLMPIKSLSLEKIEQMESAAAPPVAPYPVSPSSFSPRPS